MILAGDIGGTNARLALFDGGPTPVSEQSFRTAEHDSLAAVVGLFLNGWRSDVAAACFGVAGPVSAGAVRAVNFPWRVSSRELAAELELPAVAVVNDLEANARGIAGLGPYDFAVLNQGDPQPAGNRAVVSAGTGLGEAALWWDGTRYRALASEGGHADFAPRTDIEVALFRYLATHFGHVSYERVCSGPGLVNIYRFLGGDAVRDAAAITGEAALDPSGTGAQALDLFASILGARAGNVALGFMATGGVYLGGGIAPRIAGKLADGGFMRAFCHKGRLSSVLERMPVSVVLNDRAALLGAAAIAAERAATLNGKGSARR